MLMLHYVVQLTGNDRFLIFGFLRYDSNSGGEREIQRTMLELLNQLDGFDSRGDVKVIIGFRFTRHCVLHI